MRGGCSPQNNLLANDKIDRPTIYYTETKRRSFAARSKLHHSLKSPLCLWELDIVWHSIRKLRTMKKYILSLLGIFVAMAFIASCQQEGTTVTEEPANGPPAYMNRPAPSPTR